MPTTSVRRTILFLLFVTLLAVAWPASAAGAERENILSAKAGELAIPELFNRLVSFLRGVERKEGCNIDPWGRCEPEAKPSQRKEGCHIDPWGRCLS